METQTNNTLCDNCHEVNNGEHCCKQYNPTKESKNIQWAFSILSDAQEFIQLGHNAEAYHKINDAKRVLLGKYEEHDGGFSIEIIRGRLN